MAQLESHARDLASRQEIDPRRGPERLLRRLADNERVIRESYEVIADALAGGRTLSPAAEWVLDNYYLIEEQVQIARTHLPPRYSRELPRLMTGPLRGFPCVYELALDLVSHTDGVVDRDTLSAMVRAYQTVRPLSQGELWAVPIMLRLTLVENLRRVAFRIAWRRRHRGRALQWSQRFVRVVRRHPKDLMLELAEFVRSDPALTSPFVAELAMSLEGTHPAIGLVLQWIEQSLEERGQTIELVQQAESQAQAADHVSIGNSVTSLRALDAINWRSFAESLSSIDAALRRDPSGTYPQMDFSGRDRYSHVVESLARRAGRPETEVAEIAVALAARSFHSPAEDRRAAHVGYYLAGEGRRELERAVGCRARGCRHASTLARWPLRLYISLAALLSVILTLPFALQGWVDVDARPGVWMFAVLPFVLLAVSRSAMLLLNWVMTRVVPPRSLPRMDFSKGIPDAYRTAVILPTLLARSAVDDLVQQLELHYLANRQDNLLFGLLTDFPDAPGETMPGEADVLDAAVRGIRRLNGRHPCPGGPRFFLLHRPRQWNPVEGVWMARERKRGKVADFNLLVTTGDATPFVRIEAEIGRLRTVRGVITLDADTQLPPEAAWKLVGTLAHPLNRPRFDPATRCVVEGYGVLQPRLAPSLVGARSSRFASLLSGEVGLDPYTREVSDVFHDLCGQTSFVGKGIYDVHVFTRAVAGRFPPNRILSHDHLEGGHARCGFVSDVELVEGGPSRYLAETGRRHRWIRGDWQIARWLARNVPDAAGRPVPNCLGGLPRWVLFENLRRSLLPAALLVTALCGWFVPGLDPRLWTASLVVVFFLPWIARSLAGALQKARRVPWRPHLGRAATNETRSWVVDALDLLFLPHQAAVWLDAVFRALWRLKVSGRRLLEWQTAAEGDRRARTDLPSIAGRMWMAPVVGAGVAAAALAIDPARAGPAVAAGAIWFLSPLVAWWLSAPLRETGPNLGADRRAFLRRMARRTWAYFEHHASAEHHGLPPDNCQMEPRPTVAARTSPTNVGFGLLSDLAAYDFGYLAAGGLLDRVEASLRTLEGLERHRGHFYNWYDTHTLRALHPLYVSAVDSGNLAMSLLVLRRGLDELATAPPLPAAWRDGIADTAAILLESLGRGGHTEGPDGGDALRSALRAFEHGPDDSAGLAGRLEDLGRQLAEAEPRLAGGEDAVFWLAALRRQVGGLLAELRASTPGAAGERLRRITDLAQRCEDLAEMDWEFLYNPDRHLLALGYNCDARRLDPSFYDLLASEARLASFLIVARGDAPLEHWFHLGRQVAPGRGPPVLVSWSGSMFEYLMPRLLMPSFPGTLLAAAESGAVRRQMRYGRRRGIPWGISESCYHQVDAQLTYQYRAFGVPGLGLKRGLADDLVVAPYAAALALMVAPEDASQNLEQIAACGWTGRYGFYEAIDFTPSRIPKGDSCAPVPVFMAHHSGMTMLALDEVLRGAPMQRRFLADPEFRAAALLLQERVPLGGAAGRIGEAAESPERLRPRESHALSTRVITRSDPVVPDVHLFSNGRYQVMVTSAGGGFSRWRGAALTRWREDATRDPWGSWIYLADADSGEAWSVTPQPRGGKTEFFEVVYSQGMAEFRSRRNGLAVQMDVTVSPEDDLEVRRVTLSNLHERMRTVEVTTYAELALAPGNSEAAHPAFNGLFVETEAVPEHAALLAHRRPRAPDEAGIWLWHMLAVYGGHVQGGPSFETDRARFLGRGRDAARPAALDARGPLTGTVGCVLDPAIAIRKRILLQAGETVTLYALMGAAERREDVVRLVEKYRDHRLCERVFDLAWTHSQALLHNLGADESDAQLFARMAGSIVFANPRHRAGPAAIARNRRGQSALWSYGVSGDLPVVLVRVSEGANLDLVRRMIQAHAYWRHKGLDSELVIWTEAFSGYRQSLLDAAIGLVHGGAGARMLDQPGGIFVRSVDQVPEEDRALFHAVARIVISDRAGSLAEQVDRRRRGLQEPARLDPLPPRKEQDPNERLLPPRELRLHNGLGGFTPDGREYVVQLRPGETTPAPWVNVLANPSFGTVISEAGSAYTWFENSHEFRLTPWHNDPVGDPTGEAFYVRDEETRRFWSPTPLPARGPTPYVCRHGLGYTAFEHTQDGVFTEMHQFVPEKEPLKFTLLTVRNLTDRPRRISITGYCEWVLGDLRERNAMHVVVRLDAQTGALLASNAFSHDFPGRVAFFHCSRGDRSLTADRTEFIGRNGSLAVPAALRREALSNHVTAGMDPCAAFRTILDVPAGGEERVAFVLGAASSEDEARSLLRRFGGVDSARSALEGVWEFWKRQLGGVYVETPDESLNFLVNHWLLYQVLASRLWGRTGFYQSGGAFGFRDQLQDSLALLHEMPWMTRRHLLLCAARQFPEGDVQHWWHPPSGRGVRTTIADDYLWLPYAISRYVEATGDTGVLDEPAPFIQGRRLGPGEESYFDLPLPSERLATLYQHGVLAVEHALRFGAHGLPLMQGGDWNDGMNRLGREGRGESVWLAFFLYDVLRRYADVAERVGDAKNAAHWRGQADELRNNIERHAWDGDWYLRAFADGGERVGSKSSPECRIDAIPQAWAVLSGAAATNRAARAMEAAVEHLVDREGRLVRLFTPPFDTGSLDPGYIRGYAPGVRENGGQYTHAAVWLAMAFAARGDAAGAWDLFDLLNPVSHAVNPEAVARYRVEPYVVAADVYTAPGHHGRGGWTWYTGSAGWMYQLLVGTLLGLRIKADCLSFAPLFHPEWSEYRIHYRYRDTFYHCHVTRSGEGTGVRCVTVDNDDQPDRVVHLVDDGREHKVEVQVG